MKFLVIMINKLNQKHSPLPLLVRKHRILNQFIRLTMIPKLIAKVLIIQDQALEDVHIASAPLYGIPQASLPREF